MSDMESPTSEGKLENALDPRAHDFLFGHAAAREQLVHAFEGSRFPQAWLITGAIGIGKSTFAWHFARQLAETGKITFDYRASEEVLLRYQEHNHPHVTALTRPTDDKKGFKAQIPIELVRNTVEKMQMAPTEGGWRAVIIDPMEAMNSNASNALLKLLEEPPARVAFFLISHAPNLLLPTIKSRCQILRLGGLSIEDMKQNWSKITSDQMADENLLKLADGSMRSALSQKEVLADIYSMALGIVSKYPQMQHDQFLSFASKINTGNRSETFDRAKEVFGLLIGRVIRAATTDDVSRETAFAQTMYNSNLLGKWAELGFETARALDDAARLNLDAEIAIFHRWCAIEEMLKS